MLTFCQYSEGPVRFVCGRFQNRYPATEWASQNEFSHSHLDSYLFFKHFLCINPHCAGFIYGKLKTYFHFLSSHNSEMAHVVEIIPQRRPEPVDPAYLIPWLMMSW